MVGEGTYERLVTMLDDLIDQVGEDESHPLASMMDVLSALVENYENANVPEMAIKQLNANSNEIVDIGLFVCDLCDPAK